MMEGSLMSGGFILTVYTYAPSDEGGWGRIHHAEEQVTAADVDNRRRYWTNKGYDVEVEPW